MPATEPRIAGLSLDTLVTTRLCLPLVLLVVLWTWESIQPFFDLPRDRYRHAARNVTITLLNAVLMGISFGTLTFLATQAVERTQTGLLYLIPVPAGRFILALILLDVWMYVWHWLNHRIPLLWRFHRMHHSDLNMDVTTATRFHIGEHVISGVLRLMLIPLFGLSLWQIVVYEIAVVAMIHFHHANITIGKADRWLRCLVVTPDMHKVHHSRWQPETDSNYAVVLSVWDRLARTFRLNDDPRTISFGLDDLADDRWQTIAAMLKTPFVGERPGRQVGDVENEQR